jgi:hypothetical protein
MKEEAETMAVYGEAEVELISRGPCGRGKTDKLN